MTVRAVAAMDVERLEARGNALVLGVVLFLGSELMFFASWFAAYYDLRVRSAVWPPPGVHISWQEPTLGAGLLIISDVISTFGVKAVKSGHRGRAQTLIGGAAGLGLLFIGLTLHGWSKLSFTVGSHAYGSVFYGILGFHAAHVLVGVILLTIVAIEPLRPAFRRANGAGAEAISYYWHFVLFVWLGIWPTIYFVK